MGGPRRRRRRAREKLLHPHFYSAISGRRYYNASTGRWLSRDPIGEKGGKNLYGFVANDPCNHFDLWGHNVYRVTSSKLSGTTPLHRQIVGDDGNGGAYVLEFFGKKCSYSVGLCGYYLVGKGELSVGKVNQSAADYIKDQELNIVETVETSNVCFYPSSNGSVDSHLAADAMATTSGSGGVYVFIFNDCGTVANPWIRHAKDVLKQAENSVPMNLPGF